MDFLYFLSFILIVFIILIFLFQVREQKKIREQIFELANNTLELTPEGFLKMRNKSFGGVFVNIKLSHSDHFKSEPLCQI